MSKDDTASLEKIFGLSGAVSFEKGQKGLPRAVIRTGQGLSHVYLHGAHVAHFELPGSRPVLWLSNRSMFEPGKPIRGGVPICFPWFSTRPDDPSAPNHGVVRLRDWRVESTCRLDNQDVEMVLACESDGYGVKWWPGSYSARYTVRVGRALELALEFTNTSDAESVYTHALHSYFAVGDIRRISISGIEKADSLTKKAFQNEPIRFAGPVTGLYVDTDSTCILEDQAWSRRITVEKAGSLSTVVWNPWVHTPRQFPDLNSDDWQEFVCIETANIAHNGVKLKPGQSHRTVAKISCESI